MNLNRIVCMLLMLASHGARAANSAGECPFTYTATVRDRIIAPVVKAGTGRSFPMYDLTRPMVTDFQDSVVLIFDSKSGHLKNRLFVNFDKCQRRASIMRGPFL
jgi:hypothetical protein